MAIIIFLIIIIGVPMLINIAIREANFQKLKPIVKDGVRKGLPESIILALLIRDATRSVGRALTESQVNNIRAHVKRFSQGITPEGQLIPDVNLFDYLAKNIAPVLLQNNERVVTVIPGVGLREPRSIRITKGTYGGPSFRVAKGVRINTGGFRSRSESHEELRDIDGGDLAVTNQRIVFSGPKKTINAPFKKIVGLEANNNFIILHRDSRERAQYFVWPNNFLTLNGKPFSGSDLRDVIERQIQTN